MRGQRNPTARHYVFNGKDRCYLVRRVHGTLLQRVYLLQSGRNAWNSLVEHTEHDRAGPVQPASEHDVDRNGT